MQYTQVTTLILTNNKMGEHDSALTQAFAQALQGTKVTTLDLSWNQMGKHAITLARGLQGTLVATLNLTGNCLYDEKAVDMVRALRTTHVHTLILNDNDLQGRYWIAELKSTKIHTLCLANNRLKDLNTIAHELAYTSIKHINVSEGCLFINHHGLKYSIFNDDDKTKQKNRLIQQVTLLNCRCDYIHRLGLAEQHGYILKELYQTIFSKNTRPFPPKIACLIAKFLGYEQDKNLLKRFLDTLTVSKTKISFRKSIDNFLTPHLSALVIDDTNKKIKNQRSPSKFI